MKRWALAGLGAMLFLAGCALSAAELRQRAVSEFQVQNMPEAEKLLERALDKDPFDAVSLFYMGRIKHVQGNYEQAMSYYQRALRMDPSLSQARIWLGRAEEQLGKTGKMLRYVPDLAPQPNTDR